MASFCSFLSDLPEGGGKCGEVCFLLSITEGLKKEKRAERSGKIGLILLILKMTRNQQLNLSFAICIWGREVLTMISKTQFHILWICKVSEALCSLLLSLRVANFSFWAITKGSIVSGRKAIIAILQWYMWNGSCEIFHLSLIFSNTKFSINNRWNLSPNSLIL